MAELVVTLLGCFFFGLTEAKPDSQTPLKNKRPFVSQKEKRIILGDFTPS